MKLRTIGDIRKEFLREFDVDVQADTIRRYDRLELFSASGRAKGNNQREYNEKDSEIARHVLMLLSIGVPIREVREKNKVAIDSHIVAVEKILTELKGKRGINGNYNSSTAR